MKYGFTRKMNFDLKILFFFRLHQSVLDFDLYSRSFWFLFLIFKKIHATKIRLYHYAEIVLNRKVFIYTRTEIEVDYFFYSTATLLLSRKTMR